MITMKVFNEAGVRRFSEFLYNLKDNSQTPKPDINLPNYLQEFDRNVEFDTSKRFSTRFELAAHLSDCFEKAGVKYTEVAEIGGLWTWLACTMIDQLIPVLSNGDRDVKAFPRYVFDQSYNRSYRHLVYFPYMSYSIHGEKNTRLFLHSPLTEHNDFVEQLASSGYIWQYKGILNAAHILYWDEANRAPKRGAQTRGRKGTIRRFVRVLGQLELTYDIFSMSGPDIISLLPGEFGRWET